MEASNLSLGSLTSQLRERFRTQDNQDAVELFHCIMDTLIDENEAMKCIIQMQEESVILCSECKRSSKPLVSPLLVVTCPVRGMQTLLYTPAIDDRAGEPKIHSRIGIAADAIAFDADYDFFAAIHARQAAGPLHCVLVDEAQFLEPKQVLQLTLVCDRLSIPVLCYGIRTDFQGEPFAGSKYLLAWADNIIEIKTICRSGKKATMNARLDATGTRVTEGRQIDIGHHYEAMSRKEFRLDEVSPVARTANYPRQGSNL